MTLPATCAVCKLHSAEGPDGSQCCAHAPSPTDTEFVLVSWPRIKITDRCGSGISIGEDEGGIVPCGRCMHWWQPGEKPLEPAYRQGKGREWWSGTGLCTRYAPSPAHGTSSKGTFWTVTHETQGCGDGEAVPDEESEEDGITKPRQF